MTSFEINLSAVCVGVLALLILVFKQEMGTKPSVSRNS